MSNPIALLPVYHMNQKSTYNLYSNEIIPCAFCLTMINLYYVNNHMKTLRCQKLQTLCKRVNGAKEYNKLLLEQKRNINKIKSDVKLQDIVIDPKNEVPII